MGGKLTPEQAERKALKSKAIREQRKAEHRCTTCGEQDARTLEGWTLCAECREKRMDYIQRAGGYKATSMYEPAKKAHVCYYCGKQDAYTLSGRIYCFECSEKRNEKARQRRAENREQEIERGRDRYRRAKEQGLCSSCGKPLDRDGVFCRRCNKLRNDKYARRRRQAEQINWPRGDNGICWQCNKEPVWEDKKLCKACYDKSVRQLREKADPGRDEYNELTSRKYNAALFVRR